MEAYAFSCRIIPPLLILVTSEGGVATPWLGGVDPFALRCLGTRGNVRLEQEFGIFGQGAGDSSPALHEGHRGIFNVHQVMSADGTPT